MTDAEWLDEVEERYRYWHPQVLVSKEGVAIPVEAVISPLADIPRLIALARKGLDEKTVAHNWIQLHVQEAYELVKKGLWLGDD